MSPRTFKLTIAYDGTGFAGWQIQPGRPTIQASLEQALRAITKARVPVVGSGRTDAGVHALAQVASCVVPRWRASDEALAVALNTKLPDAISVVSAEAAPDGFHAIRDATGKRYRYQIRVGGPRDPFAYRYRWQLPGPLDIAAMQDAARRLVGRHDFKSFQASGSDRKTTVREVRACEVARDGTNDLSIEVEADGFLYNMVRNIVGSLVEVGRGKRPAPWIEQVVAARNRDVAGPTAPPQGLFLQRVDYARPAALKTE